MTNIQIKDFILAILKKAYPNNNEQNHPNSLRKPKAVTNRRATRAVTRCQRALGAAAVGRARRH